MALQCDRRLATAYHKLSAPPVLLCLLGAVSNCVVCWGGWLCVHQHIGYMYTLCSYSKVYWLLPGWMLWSLRLLVPS